MPQFMKKKLGVDPPNPKYNGFWNPYKGSKQRLVKLCRKPSTNISLFPI